MTKFGADHLVCSKWIEPLTSKQLEMHGCILSTEATYALVLKHQAISIHSTDKTLIVLDQLHFPNITFMVNSIGKYEIAVWKKITQLF